MLETIIRNRMRRVNGMSNNIPFPFPKIEKILPGIEREQIHYVTGGTGTGKTKLTKKLYVFTPIEEALKDDNIDLRIIYFALEESRERFVLSMYSYFLYKYYGLDKTVNQLLSIGKEELTISEMDLITEITPFIEDILKYIDIVTEVRNPTGIYYRVKSFLDKTGKTSHKMREIDGKEVKVRDKYTPDHENRYTIIVVDHMSLLSTEKDCPTLHSSMSRMSSTYFLDLRDFYKCTCVGVVQQMAQQESVDHFKYNKIEPSLQGIADNKTITRDANKVFGCFLPARYDLGTYRKVKVTNNLFSFSIIKNREGLSNIHLLLDFMGSVGDYSEFK